MPLDLRSLIYGSNSNSNENVGAGENIGAAPQQSKRKRVRIQANEDGEKTTAKKTSSNKIQKLNQQGGENGNDDHHENNVEEEDEEEQDVSVQGEAAATAAAPATAAAEIVHNEEYEYDEKAATAAKRLKKTTTQLHLLFGQNSDGDGHDGDDDDVDELDMDCNEDDDEKAMSVRKLPPTTTTTTAVGATTATTTTTAVAAITSTATNANNEETATAKAGPTRKRARLENRTADEKLLYKQRQDKMLERFREWKCVRNRWKNRKVDLRNEVDVGNAIHRTIARLHQEQQEQQLQQQQAEEQEKAAATVFAADRESLEQRASANDDDDDDDVNYSTDDEQEILLNRLLQGNAHARQQQQQAAAAAAGGGNNDMVQSDSVEATLAAPYAQRGLDYWELGLTQPRPQKFAHIRYVPTYKERIMNAKRNKNKRTRTSAQQQQQQQQQQHASEVASKRIAAYEAENDRLGFYSFPYTTTTMPLQEFHASSSAWPLSHPSRINARVGPEHGWFFHRRLVLRLAARQLVGAPITIDDHGGSTTMSSTNNRMIRALWNTKLADSHRQSLLLWQAQNAGLRMEAFLTHVWKDRTTAANLLGVSVTSSSTARMDEEQRGQAAVMAGLPVALMGTTLRPYADLCKYYIERLVRQASTGQRIEWDPSAKHGITQKKKGRQHFTAMTSYIPTPGTEPPIPSSPLDETQCIFGPMDKNATAQHASYFTDGQEIPTVDDTVYRLTLSTLLARWATAIAAAPSAASTAARTIKTSDNNFLLDDDDDDIGIDENVQKHNDFAFMLLQQIERTVQQSVDLNKNNKYKHLGPLSWMDDSEDGLPLVPLYRAMLGYCSLEASGYREQQGSNSHNNNHWDNDDNEYSDHDDDSYSRRKVNARHNRVTLKNIAQETIQFCEKHQDHNGLLSFPKLHMILTLLAFSTELPESGVEILAQPLDEKHHQTPFDILRSLLEHLEEEEFISNNVAILEFAMYQAAERFGRRCVQKDPAQAIYHTWYLGTLAGCLLLCSGNRIGSGARRFPSSLSSSVSSSLAGVSGNHRFRRSLGGDSNVDSPPHEVRRKLPKFHELRLETARAFKLLLQLTKYQQSPRCNIAIASFLEWREVIALMLGPPSFVELYHDPLDDIRALHSWHFDDLILSGQVPSAVLTEFQRRMSQKRSNRDCRLTFFANALERDPGHLKSWRALVRALGPVGVQVDRTRREFCAECQECRRVHKHLNVDHESFNHDRDCDSGGWGKSRFDWWEDHLLHVPKVKPGQSIETAMFCSIVESELGSILVGEQSDEAGDEDEIDDSTPSLKWLDDIISSNLFANPVTPAPSAVDRQQVYDMDLPGSLFESSHEDSDSESDSIRDGDDIPLMHRFPFDDGATVKNEVICYKLAVACHLYGLLHPLVDRILVVLFNECWDEVQDELLTDCSAWACIAWLHSWVGLDVLAPIRKALSSQPNISATVAAARPSGAQVKLRRVNNHGDDTAYPAAMCEALREGIQLFGFKKWIDIHRHNPEIFDGYGPRKAQKCYTYMVKNGLIEKIDTVPYPTAMCEAVREGFQMFGFKWTKIQRHFPDIFEGHYLGKAYDCYKHMIKKGLMQPMQSDGSDTASVGGGFDDDDGASVNADKLIGIPVGVQRAPDIPTNDPELEREAVRITQETLSSHKQQTPLSELHLPPTDVDPNSSSDPASALIALPAGPVSTAAVTTAPTLTAGASTAPMPTNANELESKRIMQEILKNAVSTELPARAPKRRKSRKKAPGVEKTIEDFERESMRIMNQASQKWFPGYKPPENLHQHVIQRRSSEPQLHAESQLPPDPIPQPPEARVLPPALDVTTQIANDSGATGAKPLSRSTDNTARKVTHVSRVARKNKPAPTVSGPTGSVPSSHSNEVLEREATHIMHQVSQMQSPGYTPMPDIADEAMRIVEETLHQQKKAAPSRRQRKSAPRKTTTAATTKKKRDRSEESETEDIQQQQQTPRRSQQQALSAKPQLPVRRLPVRRFSSNDLAESKKADEQRKRAPIKTATAATTKQKRDRSAESETEDIQQQQQQKTPRRSQQQALSAKRQLPARRLPVRRFSSNDLAESKKADDDDGDDKRRDQATGILLLIAAAKTSEAVTAFGAQDKRGGPSGDEPAGYAEV